MRKNFINSPKCQINFKNFEDKYINPDTEFETYHQPSRTFLGKDTSMISTSFKKSFYLPSVIKTVKFDVSKLFRKDTVEEFDLTKKDISFMTAGHVYNHVE